MKSISTVIYILARLFFNFNYFTRHTTKSLLFPHHTHQIPMYTKNTHQTFSASFSSPSFDKNNKMEGCFWTKYMNSINTYLYPSAVYTLSGKMACWTKNERVLQKTIKNTQNKTKNNILVVGLGLIGSSLSQSLIRSKKVGKVYGYDKDKEVISYAKEKKFINEEVNNLRDGIIESDIIIFSVPVSQIDSCLDEAKNFFNTEKVFSDTLSSKKLILERSSILIFLKLFEL